MGTDGAVTIYALCDDTGVRYIGRTAASLEVRLRQHLYHARHEPRGAKDAWIGALLAEGKMPTIMALARVTEEQAAVAELDHIKDARGRGCLLTNSRGQRATRQPRDDYRCSVLLPQRASEELRRIASRENRNVSAQMRQFIVEGIEDRKRKERAG